jgi:glycerate kinase
VHQLGYVADVQPMSDGGEGFRAAFRGDTYSAQVSGPLGESVTAHITMCSSDASTIGIIESADAVGRQHLVAPTAQQALSASSAGVGELILAAAQRGANSVIVGLGGSATSDGGLGCYEVLRESGGLPVPVIGATDITARFSGARRYAEQKGIRHEDLLLVDQRLASAHDLYFEETGVDVEAIERSGAAGGISGAIAALGGSLVDGLGAVADAVSLASRLREADLVITGEGRFDEGSLEGKVTAGIAAMTNQDVPLLLICGSVDDDPAKRLLATFANCRVVSLVDRVGLDVATRHVLAGLRHVALEELQTMSIAQPRRRK